MKTILWQESDNILILIIPNNFKQISIVGIVNDKRELISFNWRNEYRHYIHICIAITYKIIHLIIIIVYFLWRFRFSTVEENCLSYAAGFFFKTLFLCRAPVKIDSETQRDVQVKPYIHCAQRKFFDDGGLFWYHIRVQRC